MVRRKREEGERRGRLGRWRTRTLGEEGRTLEEFEEGRRLEEFEEGKDLRVEGMQGEEELRVSSASKVESNSSENVK